MLPLLLMLCLVQNPFTEEAKALGLDFVHENGRTGQFFYPEINGAGVALFDYDNDGDLDLYAVQGRSLKPEDANKPGPMDRLYRNDLKNGKAHFTDVTEASGIRATGFGFGAIAADFDNDGWMDIYVTNFGANQLWRNKGDGSFEDVTEASGTAGTRWSTSATFFDYDRDGYLDLFVTNYLHYGWENHKTCVTSSGIQDYCGPKSYDDARDRLLRNQGDGTFKDVTLSAGLHQSFGAGMGVVAADFNGDHWLDLYVANDADPNLLWLNNKDGSFSEDGLLAGCAVNSFGVNEAGMGVAVGDLDGNGAQDLVVTHLTGETHTYYRNDGSGLFEDQTLAIGLGTPSLEATGWGTALFDYDNDGWLDLFVANGAVEAIGSLVRKKDPFPFHQPNQLFRNQGGKRLQEVKGGAAMAHSEVSRGAAFGDIDNDGDMDIVVANNMGPLRVLVNQVGNKANWVGLNLKNKKAGYDLLGSLVCLSLSDGRQLWRRVAVDGSYLSGSDPRVLFGLGKATPKGPLRIILSNGKTITTPVPTLKTYGTITP